MCVLFCLRLFHPVCMLSSILSIAEWYRIMCIYHTLFTRLLFCMFPGLTSMTKGARQWLNLFLFIQ